MVLASQQTVSIRAEKMRAIDEVCQSSLGCTQGDMLNHLLLFVATGMVTLLFVVAMVYLRRAEQAASEEHSRTVAERDAFAKFARQIADLTVDSTQAQMAPAAVSLATVSAQQTGEKLKGIQNAYRNTVMSVPHYDDDYGESLYTNMAAEFGEDLATAIVHGNQLTPQLKQVVIQRSRDAERKRTDFIATLDNELNALTEASDDLTEIEETLHSMNDQPLTTRSFDELTGFWHQLGDLDDQCRSVLDYRQDRIQDTNRNVRSSDNGHSPSLFDFLYQSLPVTYPILAAGVSLNEQIQTARSRVVLAITRRV